MTYVTQQCSFCLRVRYYTDDGWSEWMKDLPKNVKCECYHAALCSDEKCVKKRADLTAQNR